MKINVVKKHDHYALGEHEVTEERGNYLITMGVAEKVLVSFPTKKEIQKTVEKSHVKAPSKQQVKPKKEKHEL